MRLRTIGLGTLVPGVLEDRILPVDPLPAVDDSLLFE